MAITISCTVAEALKYVRDSGKDRVVYARRDTQRTIAKVRKNAKLVAKLALVLPNEAELRVNGYWSYADPDVRFPRELLPAVRAAVGRLHVEGKELENSDERTIRVTLRAEKYPGISFSYVRTLAEGSACQIVEQTSTYKTLACSIS